MRTLRLALAGAIVLALGGVLHGAVLAQEEATGEDVTWPKLTKRLSYGDDTKQLVHVYEPRPRAEARPAVVLYHGGGLVYGDPIQDDAWAKRLAEQGYVTFTAGYRLFREWDGANPWPAQIDDARRALRWVRANAEAYNVDPRRVCVAGHSSGGQLAGLLGTTDGPDDADPALAGVSGRADCVVSIAGNVDLLVPSDDVMWTETVTNRIFGGSVDEVPEVWQAASPAHNVGEDTVPFLVIQGNEDEAAFIQAARNLAAELAAAEREFVHAEVPGDHFDVLDVELIYSLQEAFLAAQLHPER